MHEDLKKGGNRKSAEANQTVTFGRGSDLPVIFENLLFRKSLKKHKGNTDCQEI